MLLHYMRSTFEMKIQYKYSTNKKLKKERKLENIWLKGNDSFLSFARTFICFVSFYLNLQRDVFFFLNIVFCVCLIIVAVVLHKFSFYSCHVNLLYINEKLHWTRIFRAVIWCCVIICVWRRYNGGIICEVARCFTKLNFLSDL